MISYKRDVLERQSLSELKMGRCSPICERVRKKIVEYFKNNVPQCQIAKPLQILSSTVHNLIKRLRETGEISVCKGQGRRPLLDACGQPGMGCCKWAQEYIQKPLSGKHNPPCHLQMPIKVLSRKMEAIFEHGP